MKQCNSCKQHKQLDEFHKHAKTSDGRVPRCKACSKLANRNWFNKTGSATLSKRRVRIRELIQLSTSLKLQTGCIVCGEDDEVCLDWHHVEPAKKTHNISYIIENLNNSGALLTEIQKCVCLCCNCHKKVHAGKLTHTQTGVPLLIA